MAAEPQVVVAGEIQQGSGTGPIPAAGRSTVCCPAVCSSTACRPAACSSTVCCPAVCRSTVYRPATGRPSAGRPTAGPSAACRSTAGRSTVCLSTVCRSTAGRPAVCRPAVCPPTVGRSTVCRPTAGRPTACRKTVCSQTAGRSTACRQTAGRCPARRDRSVCDRAVRDRPLIGVTRGRGSGLQPGGASGLKGAQPAAALAGETLQLTAQVAQPESGHRLGRWWVAGHGRRDPQAAPVWAAWVPAELCLRLVGIESLGPRNWSGPRCAATRQEFAEQPAAPPTWGQQDPRETENPVATSSVEELTRAETAEFGDWRRGVPAWSGVVQRPVKAAVAGCDGVLTRSRRRWIVSLPGLDDA